MSQLKFTVKISIDGQPTSGLDVFLSDPTGSYGIKRNDSSVVVVADSELMADEGGGFYSYTFTQPEMALSYTGWIEYSYDSQVYHYSNVFSGTDEATAAEISAGAVSEAVICYEDRQENFHTGNWRVDGVRTSAASANTDGGQLWMNMTRSENTVNAAVYKSQSQEIDSLVASGEVDISSLADGSAGFADIALNAINGGPAVSFRLYKYIADGSCKLQVLLCDDADVTLYYQGADKLSACDEDSGLAETISAATAEVLAKVLKIFNADFDGKISEDINSQKLWDDYSQYLKTIVNIAELKRLCVLKTLAIALRRDHIFSQDSHFANMADHFSKIFDENLQRLALCLSENEKSQPQWHNQSVLRLSRS